ncbi:phytanoyl-CoA dioxygenase family protein [Pseudaestuariivita atlantica]|uniref:Phytanoyl-CoA dioxygenase n=1 Tax=Pseudaestuariivita atlantica TaxID=1317121 RepID=A0A0L1JQH9_9RHOB|nr:phytanoyl-CoA dioxygenase family protein [Pseudaestuariivita atlantica]KNG94039.1 phytanoyl-CoA dioxygenase [Pseudaestuariivita atlantica]
MALDLTAGKLGAAQQEAYWRDGYLHPIRVMDGAEAAGFRTRFETLEHDWLDNGLPKALNVYKRTNSHVVMPDAAALARDSRVLDVVEGVLGPDIAIFSAEFFVKEPRTDHIVSMHQDLTYWGLGAIDGLVTAWIAISPATRASGCMDFVQGSHKNAILEHEDTYAANNLLSRGQEVKVDIAPEDRVAIELQPGEMSLHHGLTIHGSGPNTSADRRIGFVIRYIRPDMVPQGGIDYAMAARGRQNPDNFRSVPVPQADFAPEAVALHEEIRQHQASVMMAGAKGASAEGMYE